MQNIPKRDYEMMNMIRRAIYPLEGYQIAAIDYSGVEVIAGCFYHKDPVMLKYVTDKSTDMHKDMAVQLYKLKSLDKHHSGTENNPGEKNLRQGAKNGFVFPQFYGDYWRACAKNLWEWKKGVVLSDGTPIDVHLKKEGIGAYKKFEKHVEKVEEDFWKNRFRIYNKWKEHWYNTYLENGYIDMLSGFRCQGVFNQKQACNWPIQGTAFHLLLWSFKEVNKWLKQNKMKSCMMGQIHDEMLLHVHPSERDVVMEKAKEIMTIAIRETFDWINVPLEVEADICPVDRPWNEKGEYKFAA